MDNCGNMKVSIVIPVYNVEDYLEDCINSCLNQTYNNIEIIVVDDGSTDGCPLMCDQFARINENIRVIHKTNGGLSDARNVGIQASTGDFVLLLDSDDWLVEKDMIEKMVMTANSNNASIVVSNTLLSENIDLFCADSNEKKPLVLNRIDAMQHMLYREEFGYSAWGKLYKKELFANVLYPVGLFYEDLATTYKLVNSSKIVVYSEDVHYGYRIRTGSIMDKPVKEYLFEMSKKVLDDISLICPEAMSAEICSHSHQVFCVLTQNYSKLDLCKRKELKKELKKYLVSILNDRRVTKSFKLKMMLVCLSPKITSMLRSKFAKMR